jgi:hypothetical protein
MQLRIGGQTFAQRGEVDRLDQVVQRAFLHGGAHGRHVARGGEQHHVGPVVIRRAQPTQDAQPTCVGEIDVEQHEVGVVAGSRVERGRGGVRVGDDRATASTS